MRPDSPRSRSNAGRHDGIQAQGHRDDRAGETLAMASRQEPKWPRSRLWNASHDRRLARLEQAKLEQERRPATKVFYVWRNDPAESTKAAIARTFPLACPRTRAS
jgi:hypothetical protein